MSIVRTVSRLAIRRGMKAGSREWLASGVVLALASWSKRRAQDQQQKVLHREVLQPGESVSIAVSAPEHRSRRQRSRAGQE